MPNAIVSLLKHPTHIPAAIKSKTPSVWENVRLKLGSTTKSSHKSGIGDNVEIHHNSNTPRTNCSTMCDLIVAMDVLNFKLQSIITKIISNEKINKTDGINACVDEYNTIIDDIKNISVKIDQYLSFFNKDAYETLTLFVDTYGKFASAGRLISRYLEKNDELEDKDFGSFRIHFSEYYGPDDDEECKKYLKEIVASRSNKHIKQTRKEMMEKIKNPDTRLDAAYKFLELLDLSYIKEQNNLHMDWIKRQSHL
jgi:hypothetical protein